MATWGLIWCGCCVIPNNKASWNDCTRSHNNLGILGIQNLIPIAAFHGIFEYSSNNIRIFEPKIFEYSYSVQNVIPNVFVLKRTFRIYLYSYSVPKKIFAVLWLPKLTTNIQVILNSKFSGSNIWIKIGAYCAKAIVLWIYLLKYISLLGDNKKKVVFQVKPDCSNSSVIFFQVQGFIWKNCKRLH